ncbi:MAG TPA: hypothetical protein EYP07_03550 [Kiloniellaceae bacterium]|nr:hypothetical protein [Kiloniellaceae bacterium]
MLHTVRHLTAAALVASAAGFGTVPASADKLPLSEDEFLEDLERLGDGDRTQEDVVQSCRSSVRQSDSRQAMAEMMSGLLEVAERDAMTAMCTALVDAVASRRLSVRTIRSIAVEDDTDRVSFAVGRLLREIYFAHRKLRTSGQLSEEPRP